MLIIDNKNISDPATNLALEEHCYRNLDARHDYMLFYINKPSIIVGNHQNPFQELDLNFAEQKHIQAHRRISGGGTVYHDFGNLNFSFITGFTGDMLGDFKRLLQPILQTLQRLGVPVTLTGKNNIVVDGKKISGNSQHTNMRRLLSHGTLLLNSQLDILRRVLKSKLDIIQSRAINSIRSNVTNISDYLSHSMNMETFMDTLIAGIASHLGKLKKYQLKTEQWDAVYRLAEEKYNSWEWIFGRSPAFAVRHKFKYLADDIEVHIGVKNGRIRDINFAGDQIEKAVVPGDLAKFVGARYDTEFVNQLPE